MSGILGLLGGAKIYLLAGAGLLIAITGAYAYHTTKVSNLRSEVSYQKEKVGQCVLDLAAVTTDRDGLRVDINRQNEAVRRMEAAAVTSSALADVAAGEALMASQALRLANAANEASGPARMNGFFEGAL